MNCHVNVSILCNLITNTDYWYLKSDYVIQVTCNQLLPSSGCQHSSKNLILCSQKKEKEIEMKVFSFLSQA